ncbi:hypothetical protein AB0L40_00070 [Patulibacter sp. NPDC049589]|uniref:hypothetical protein n=1 Tax=Patulibacter sp. NPDC049589 TaxID=3154731 RepID=UPI0034357EFF
MFRRLSHRLHRHGGPAALVVSVLALGIAISGVAQSAPAPPVRAASAPAALTKASSAKTTAKKKAKKQAKKTSARTPAASQKVKAYGLLRLDKHGRFPTKAIPTVARAKLADRATRATLLGGKTVAQIQGSCAPTTVDLGTWCLDAAVQAVPPADLGKNDFAYATQRCIDLGGYLPDAAQLIGAADEVRLSSTVDDSPTSALISDPERTDRGLKDLREMSSTLVTTAAGSDSAGSEGVSAGATGDPHLGQPNPAPQPANPFPETLQYVTVYDNHDKGGFAGSAPVGQAERFRCAYDRLPGASDKDAE